MTNRGVHALDTFTQGKTLTSNQLEFIDLIINHLADNGMIDPRALYESPFTDIDDLGLSGVFSDDGDVQELVAVLKSVREKAAA